MANYRLVRCSQQPFYKIIETEEEVGGSVYGTLEEARQGKASARIKDETQDEEGPEFYTFKNMMESRPNI